MPLHKLSRGGEKLINSAVDEMFDALKMRAIGQAPKGKKLYVGFERGKSIVGVFEQAAHEEGIPPDIALLDSLTRVAGNYMDAAAARAKAKIGNAVNSWLQETSTKKDPVEPGELREQLKGHLEGLWDELTSAVRTVVDTEATQARNVSWMAGIVQMNAARGIEDPLCYFICVHDDRVCAECMRLHYLEDGSTPRVWRLSECGHGYHKRGDPSPKIGGLHPNCRCAGPVTLLPGYGFKGDGSLGFISPGHDEYTKQRGDEQPLEKMAVADYPIGSKVGAFAGGRLKENWDEKYGPGDIYDYTHVLDPEWRQKGYSVQVLHSKELRQGKSVGVVVGSLLHNNKHVGRVEGTVVPGIHDEPITIWPHTPGLAWDYRGKGFGKALYNAVYAHAYHALGARMVRGSSHTDDAARVHRGLNRQHGFEYRSNRSNDPDDSPYSNQGYQYAIKSENPLHKSSEFDPKTSTWKPLSKEKTYEDPEVQYPVPKYADHGPAKVKFKVTTTVPHPHGEEGSPVSVYNLNQDELDKVKYDDFHTNKHHFHAIGHALLHVIDAKGVTGNGVAGINAVGNSGIEIDSKLPTASALAYHTADGKTHLSPKTATRLGSMLDDNTLNESIDHEEMLVLTHELLHGASNNDHGYTTHQEKALEEASTEILANHYTPQILEHTFNQYTKLDKQHFYASTPEDGAGTSAEGDHVFTPAMAYHSFCSRFANLVSYIEGLHKHDVNDPFDHNNRLDQAVKHYAWKIKQLPGDKRGQFLVDKLLHKKLGIRQPKVDRIDSLRHPALFASRVVEDALLENIGDTDLARGFLHGQRKKLHVKDLDAIVAKAKKAYDSHMKYYRAQRKKIGLPEDHNEGDYHEAP